MGNGRSRPKQKIVNITIPNFPYPPDILDYIRSQSSGFNISYVPPGTSQAVPLPALVVPPPPEVIPLDEFPSFGGISSSAGASVLENEPPLDKSLPKIPSSTPKDTTPQRAFSEPTQKPEPTTVAPTTSPAPPAELTLPPNPLPPIWQAATTAMEFTTKLILPITTKEQMFNVYDNLQKQIVLLMGTGKNGRENIAALIYFCTVVKVAFEVFNPPPGSNKPLGYNFLNKYYPEVFSDFNAYKHFCMINSYSNHASDIFDINKTMNKYVSVDDRLTKYMVPDLLISVLAVLQEATSNPPPNT